MGKHHYRRAIGAGVVIWVLLIFGSIIKIQLPQGIPLFPGIPAAIAADWGWFDLLSIPSECDTSILDTKKGLQKPNQNKVFYHDSTWWMLAIRATTNKWNLWRYEYGPTWTPVYEFSVSNKDRPDTDFDTANNRVFVFFSSATGTSSIWQLAYVDSNRTWSLTSQNSVPSVISVTDDPASFARAKSGDLWAFMVSSGVVLGVHSTDEGVSWSSPINVDTLNQTSGLTDVVAFTDSSSTNSIALAVAENSGTGSRYFFYLHPDGMPDSYWVDESSNLLPIWDEDSDNHLSLTVDKNNKVYMITKTKGGGVNTPENTLYIMGQGVAVSDTSVFDTKKGLIKPNQSKVFYHDGKWWMLGIRKSTNSWHIWRYDSNLNWAPVFEFTGASSKNNPDVVMDNAANELHVFFSGKTGISKVWRISYNPSTMDWSKDSERGVPDVATVSDDPAGFVIARNGDYWAFMASDTQLIAVKSTDQGSSWSSKIVILDTLFSPNGLTDAVPFTGSDANDYIALGLAENSKTNSKYGFFIHKDGDPDTAWTDESANVPMIGLERSDDHIAMAVDRNNNVYMVTKTTGGGTGTPENSLYKRMPDGTFQGFILIDGTDWTRPALVVDDEHDSLYVFGTRETASLGKILEYKRCKIGEEATLDTATRLTAADNGLDQFMNVSLPGHAVYDSTELMIVVDNEDQGNIWFRQFSIGTPVPRPVIGRWRRYTVIEGTDWTRPAIVVDDEHDSLYVFGTRESVSQGKAVEYKKCKIGEESTLYNAARITAIDHGLDAMMNISVSRHSVNDTTELLLIADNEVQNNVWFNILSLGNPSLCPTRIDSTIYNFTISKMGSDVKLDWDAIALADSYVVYRAQHPMFWPDTARYAVVDTNTYADVGALGDPAVNHFYLVRAFFSGVPGPATQRVGEYEYRLEAPAGKKNNFIAVSLKDPGILNASDLANRVGANVDLVSRWLEASQAWGSYIPGLSFTDFPVQYNEVYMVSVTAEDTLCLVGDVSTDHQYSLITTGGKNNNGLMLLMDADSLKMASQLATSIGPVDLISRWNNSVQAFGSYIPGLGFTDFAIVPGQPLLVSVTAPTTWPVR